MIQPQSAAVRVWRQLDVGDDAPASEFAQQATDFQQTSNGTTISLVAVADAWVRTRLNMVLIQSR